MLVIHQATTRPGLQASHYTTSLVFRLLRAQHDWASPDCARRVQQSPGGYRQVNQVDQSQAGHLPKGRQGTRLLGRARASLRTTPPHHHRLGSNFNNHQFWEYCENSGIDVRYVSAAHPRANGQVERANRMVLDAFKKRLHDAATQKGARGSRNYPTLSGSFVHNLPSQQGSHLTSWSMAPKLCYLST
jgi:hypothetical protein